ncbi:MAG: hypothetical protein HY720_31025 [Planctomycetes bacterium]|nr:hypothetical protein [Planctomycetota bacterium]
MRDLKRSDRLLIRLIQTNKLLSVEKILECVEMVKRFREDGNPKNLAMVIKDEELIPRSRLKALARAVKFNMQRIRDKELGVRLVAAGVASAEAIDRSLAAQLTAWEKEFASRPLADILVACEKTPVEKIALYLRPTTKTTPRKRRKDEEEEGGEEGPLLVLDLDDEETGYPLEVESDSDLLPPDEDSKEE